MNDILASQPTVTFMIGGLGAGKTELALNLALCYAETHGAGRVHLVDLDVVNPFFRVRRVKEELKSRGVQVITPDSKVENGDLPALPAAAWGALQNPDLWTICDIGGGELGLRPLGRFVESAASRAGSVLFVVNPYRPGYRTLDEMERNVVHLQKYSALKVTHLVANPHLIHETTPEVFHRGLGMVKELGQRLSLPLAFAMAAEELVASLGDSHGVPVFPIRRFWRTPWKFGLNPDVPTVDDALHAASKQLRFGAFQKLPAGRDE